MKIHGGLVIVPVALALACGGTFPEPTQRLADAESAQRSALEVGANNQPAAQLHLKLAEEQMAKAKALIKEGDNRAADFMLVRAKADSELALALAREQNAKREAQQATDQSKATDTTNTIQGAQK